MTSTFDFLESQFFKWHRGHGWPIEFDEQLREVAFAMLVESVRSGDVVTIDGVESPLSREIAKYHGKSGFEMNTNWIGSSQHWVCPCCHRSKFQVSRVGKKDQILAKLVVHHDHMGDAMKAAFHKAFAKEGTNVEQVEGLKLVDKMGIAFAAYAEVLVCEDCNNADTEARKLVSSPKYFSFSIGQIRQFILPESHRPHKLDPLAVQKAWDSSKQAYKLRMDLIEAVACAAATDAHWYEPYDLGMKPIPLLANNNRSGDDVIQRWVSVERLEKALGPQEKVSSPNLARWRTTQPKAGKSLPSNFIAILRSDTAKARTWDSVPDEWHCPICARRKMETAYIGDQGKVIFHLCDTSGVGKWREAGTICNHCRSTLISLKTEVRSCDIELPDSYSFVSPEELAAVIIPRPHSAHTIQPQKAASLVEEIVDRMPKPWELPEDT